MYAKVFFSMYHGSLATVGPWEALVTFQQLLVLADRLGVVDMTQESISRITTVPLEIISKGIAALEQPDPGSRNPNQDGRRIVRLSEHRTWGWQIVNHAHYRAIRSAEERREYMRTKMREKRATEKGQTLPEDPAFDKFWSLYPRKVSKQLALRSWVKISPDKALADTIIAALNEQKSSPQWLKDNGQFIPHPTTWLNQRRWENAPTEIDLGSCEYCSRAAVQITKGHHHCDTPRCLDHAQGRY